MPLDGTWYNELGSVMTLEANGSSVTGTYQTAVGDAQGRYPLVGATEPSSRIGSQAVGFVVAWVNEYTNAHSVTAWSGQYQIVDGEEEIVTQWLLTQETPPRDDWASTYIGHDLYTRQPPSEDKVARRLRRGPSAHPARRA